MASADERPTADERATADERVIEVSRLAGGLAHEIRNPLSTLLLNLKLLEEDLHAELDDRSDTLRRANRRISTVRAEAERLQAMLDDFLLLVGPMKVQPDRRDLVALVRDVVTFFQPRADAESVALLCTLPADPLAADVDAAYLRQGILNLLLNALEAVTDSGRIEVNLARVGGSAELFVRDNGVGMTPDVIAKIRHAFYSTKPNGTGLGLSVTQRMIQAHGGSMLIESVPDSGSTFTLRIPLSETGA